jgi:hypothetical protein
MIKTTIQTLIAEDKEAERQTTQGEIERSVKELKTHRNASDYDKAYLSRLWREAQGVAETLRELRSPVDVLMSPATGRRPELSLTLNFGCEMRAEDLNAYVTL